MLFNIKDKVMSLTIVVVYNEAISHSFQIDFIPNVGELIEKNFFVDTVATDAVVDDSLCDLLPFDSSVLPAITEVVYSNFHE
jgi:hypothetical protein